MQRAVDLALGILTGSHNAQGSLYVRPAPVPSSANPMKGLFSKALLRLAWWSADARANRVVSGSMRSVQ